MEIGFKLVDECTIDGGTDAEGIKLRKDATDTEQEDALSTEKEDALRATRLRVMVRMPEG